MGRRQLIIFGLIGLSLAISLVLARRAPHTKASHDGCLTHADCITGERCTVVPKGDGFVTAGLCAEACADESTCPNGWKCAAFAEANDVVLPAGSKGTTGAPSTFCVPPTRK